MSSCLFVCLFGSDWSDQVKDEDEEFRELIKPLSEKSLPCKAMEREKRQRTTGARFTVNQSSDFTINQSFALAKT